MAARSDFAMTASLDLVLVNTLTDEKKSFCSTIKSNRKMKQNETQFYKKIFPAESFSERFT
jgi:hypothetical protein